MTSSEQAQARVDAMTVLGFLTPEEIEYCRDPARGKFVGFSALHDLMDANMRLPEANRDTPADEHVDRCNRATEEFNQIVLDRAWTGFVDVTFYEPVRAAAFGQTTPAYGSAEMICPAGTPRRFFCLEAALRYAVNVFGRHVGVAAQERAKV